MMAPAFEKPILSGLRHFLKLINQIHQCILNSHHLCRQRVLRCGSHAPTQVTWRWGARERAGLPKIPE